MFECPDCGSIHFNLIEVEYRPHSAPIYAIVCDGMLNGEKCKKVIDLHEKGIYDLLYEIKDMLDKP